MKSSIFSDTLPVLIHFIRHPLPMPQHLSAPQAQRRFSRLQRRVTITLKDHEEGWRETIEILSDPDLMRDLQEAQKEKEFVTLEELITVL